MTVLQDIQKLGVGTLVVLYELDLTECIGKFGEIPPVEDRIFRWCDGVNELGNNVVWAGNTYTRMPIEASGFDKAGDGTIPRPRLSVANIGGTVGALTRTYDDITAAKLTRTRTFLKYLDAVNFLEGNTYADGSQYLDKETWIVDRKASENSVYIEWELTAPYDLAGVKLPRRQCIQNICPWKYRGAECGYTGTAYFNILDESVPSVNQDTCGKRLSSCKARFGTAAVLPFGGFPGVGLGT